jgi:hypothetical protein
VQVWGFLQENEITKGILDDLERRFPNSEQDADKTLAGQVQVGTTESENDAICYWVLKKCAGSESSKTELDIGISLGESNYNEAVEIFRLTYAEPLFDYLDEQMDDKRMVLVLLRKFKHRCEWFHRDELSSAYRDNTGTGEKTLAAKLYEYLHDQGITFHIEPESASGRIDLISSQSGKDRLIAEAKLFNPERGQDRAYIIKSVSE